MNNQLFFFFYSLAHKSVFMDKALIFFAQTFPYLVILGAGIFLLFHHEIISRRENSFGRAFLILKAKWSEIVLVFFSGIFAWCFAQGLKFLFHTLRPMNIFQDIVPLLSKTDLSFPSGHATFFMALGFAIFLYHKKAGYWFIFFAFLIGLARIASGVHFPIDILGGFILGALIACLIRFLYQKIQKK